MCFFLIFEFNLYIADDRELNKVTNKYTLRWAIVYFLLKMWAFVLPLWAYVFVGFCPRGFCPRGFCPRGFCPRGFCPTLVCSTRQLEQASFDGIRRLHFVEERAEVSANFYTSDFSHIWWKIVMICWEIILACTDACTWLTNSPVT